MPTIAVTGANGFIGRNLVTRLREISFGVIPVAHDTNADRLAEILAPADFIVHLAGVNRPSNEQEFVTGNKEMAEHLVAVLERIGGHIPILYSSSIQANLENPYGRSKRDAERAIEAYNYSTAGSAFIFRLPNVFGKWCRPNYNSVVATFCHNISHGLPVTIDDPEKILRLVYIDDVVEQIIDVISNPSRFELYPSIDPVYEIGLGELAAQLERFRDSRTSLIAGEVGTGLLRALYATYLSYLDPVDFAYPLTPHTDPRGTFVEMLRTSGSGQFSYFTAHPGVTRGGHYHHTKTEKFLVLQGRAHFGFRHILTGETFEITTSGKEPKVVETVPGWSHDITNIGDETMIVMLWASELFDREKPDTVAAKVAEK